MDKNPVENERPYVRPDHNYFAWIVAVLAAALVGAAAYYLYSSQKAPAPQPSAPAPAPQAEAPAPQAAAEPAVKNPLPAPEAAPKPLPALENSDSMMRDSLAGLIGRKAFDDFVVPDQLVRRIVATVDNLPRRTAPRRMLPLNGVPGAFKATGDEGTIAPANAARYAPYVRVLDAVNVRALVYSYIQAYPLFQKAYEELGFPGRYFNDRLLAAIDDLVAAPEADDAKLARPKVLYEFADPELESRSAGQKIMIRMGADNARRVKAKLGEIRKEILGAGSRRP